MEYSVGSLADLISGQQTPNKPKLVSKTFPAINKEPNNTTRQAVKGPEGGDAQPKPRKLHKKPKAKKFQPPNNSRKVSGERKRKLPASPEEPLDSSPAKQPYLGKNQLNAANRIKNKFNQEIKTSTDYNEKTLFVGNIPIQTPKEKIKQLFKKYGPIDSVRIRGIPVADIKTPKKIAAIRKEFHPDRTSVYAFIRFKNAEDAKKAEVENGQVFLNHHLRVHCCEEGKDCHDESKAIFVGNLPFQAEEEELWNLFKSCGPIGHIRIVRDGRTGMGKGFAYVNFQDADSVQLALEMGTVTLKDRELRVSICEANKAKKKLGGKKPRHNRGEGKQEGEEVPKKKVAFTGSKFTDKKKKKKFSKTVAEKKTLARKLVAPKSGKTTAVV